MHLLFFLLLSAFAQASLLDRLRSADTAASPAIEVNSLTDNAGHNVKSVVDVVNLLYEMAPCNKIATSMLMNSCSSPLETSSSALDSLSTMYGTRLAVCELYNAGAQVPAACDSFLPAGDLIVKMAANRMPATGALTDPRLTAMPSDPNAASASKRCTLALFEKPQSWTSFSNSKQNSLAIYELIGVLAAVKQQSLDFNMTAHDSLQALQRLHDLAVLTQRQYNESNAHILNTAELLTTRLNKTNQDMTDLSSSALDTYSAMTDMDTQFNLMMQAVFGQMHNLSSSAADAQQNVVNIGLGLGNVEQQLHHTHDTIKLMEKTTLAYANSMQETFSFLNDIPEPAMNFLRGFINAIKFCASDLPRIYAMLSRAAVLIAIFCAVAIAAYPIYRRKIGASMLTSASASLGLGAAYTAFHALLSRGIDLYEKDHANARYPMVFAAVALTATGAALGALVSACRRRTYERELGSDEAVIVAIGESEKSKA